VLSDPHRSRTEPRTLVATQGSRETGTLTGVPMPVRAHGISALHDNGQESQLGYRARILLVDDDFAVRDSTAQYLEANGLRIATAHDQQDAAHKIATIEPDLILLDLQFGRNHGLDLLREIRSRPYVPVIVTSGADCTEIDRVVGLELGADDHLTKPFGLRELLARIRAVLRGRARTYAILQSDAAFGRYWFGGWQLDQRLRQLTAPDGQPVVLTRGEYALLMVFVDSPQRPLSRAQLLQATRTHENVFDRSVDAQVFRLRRKLETGPNPRPIIRTERGVGYVFDLPVEQHDARVRRRIA
jgi:two-component system, OmpR family, response regulator